MQCMCQNSLPGIVEFYPGAENGRIGFIKTDELPVRRKEERSWATPQMMP